MCTRSLSLGFISSVFALGVNDAAVDSCGLGGPVGTPLVWMNAKFVGSTPFGLQVLRPMANGGLTVLRAADDLTYGT
jgi:hypothetical protein